MPRRGVNPVARSRRLGLTRTKVIRPRKGKGSYQRKPKRKREG